MKQRSGSVTHASFPSTHDARKTHNATSKSLPAHSSILTQASDQFSQLSIDRETVDAASSASVSQREDAYASPLVSTTATTDDEPQNSPFSTTISAPLSHSLSVVIDSDDLDQFDGSHSSSILDHAHSPPPILSHQRGSATSNRSQTLSDANEKLNRERSSSDSEEEGEDDDDDDDDDDNPDTESGLSPEQIQALLSRLGSAMPGVKPSPTSNSASTSTLSVPGGSGGASIHSISSILRNRTSSSSATTTHADGSVSSTSSSSTRVRSRSSRPKGVSFSSCVLIREYARMQGGSSSVPRSGSYSLGLDWKIERETMAPLDVSIETLQQRARQISEPSAESSPVITEDEVLLTEPDEEFDVNAAGSADGSESRSSVSVPERSPNASPPPLPVNGEYPTFDDITVESYKNQPLKIHRRYPTNNRSEELQRISEEERIALFHKYLGLDPQQIESNENITQLFETVLMSSNGVAEESAELDEIRHSRSGNFCTCVPPKGRLRAMMIDMSTLDLDKTEVNEENACCRDESCACFRDGVGCHVESDHYCLCQGSFVEMKQKIRRSEEGSDEEPEEEEEEENDDSPREPPPVLRAGCLNPSGRYQFDERAGRDHVARFLYGEDPYGPADEDTSKILSSPPIRFARARTPSALPSFFFRAQQIANAEKEKAEAVAAAANSAAGATMADAAASPPSTVLLPDVQTRPRQTFKPALSTLIEFK